MTIHEVAPGSLDATAIQGELALMLRPAGGGIHTVSTGRAEQLELQRRLYGAGTVAEVEARWREALAGVAGARVVMLAVPSDTGAGLVRGAAFGPGALRRAVLELVPDFAERAGRAGIVDVGDVFVVPQLLHDEMLSEGQKAATRAAIYGGAAAGAALPVSPLSMAEAVIARLRALNPEVKLFVLGGDHSVAWPVVAALTSGTAAAGAVATSGVAAAVAAPASGAAAPPSGGTAWRAEPYSGAGGASRRARVLGIVHPDAHTDLLPERLGVKYCFATWAYHANERIGRGGRLVQVGVRASSRPRAHWEGTLGVRQLWAAEIAARGEAAALDDIVAHLRAVGVEAVYLSNDIDGTDAAEAPATGAPEGGGLSVGFVRALIARLGAELSLVGGDLVEVAPTIGAPEAARRTVQVGARYVLDTLAALSGSRELLVP